MPANLALAWNSGPTPCLIACFWTNRHRGAVSWSGAGIGRTVRASGTPQAGAVCGRSRVWGSLKGAGCPHRAPNPSTPLAAVHCMCAIFATRRAAGRLQAELACCLLDEARGAFGRTGIGVRFLGLAPGLGARCGHPARQAGAVWGRSRVWGSLKGAGCPHRAPSPSTPLAAVHCMCAIFATRQAAGRLQAELACCLLDEARGAFGRTGIGVRFLGLAPGLGARCGHPARQAGAVWGRSRVWGSPKGAGCPHRAPNPSMRLAAAHRMCAIRAMRRAVGGLQVELLCRVLDEAHGAFGVGKASGQQCQARHA